MDIISAVFDKKSNKNGNLNIKIAEESSSANFGIEAFDLGNKEKEQTDPSINSQNGEDYKAFYEFYKTSPNPDTLSDVVKALKPTIDYAIIQNGGKGNPFIEASAKLIAAESVKRFDPSFNTSLPTYVTSNLRKLTRLVREANQPIRIPESYIYDLAYLNKINADFIENHGREPDMDELADASKMSIKKITKLRKKFIKQVSENQFYTGSDDIEGDDSDSRSSVDDSAGSASDFTEEALDYVYKDLGHKEKKILEWTTGYGANPILTSDQIAKKLKLSTSQVNRITNKVADKLNTYLTALNDVYGGGSI